MVQQRVHEPAESVPHSAEGAVSAVVPSPTPHGGTAPTNWSAPGLTERLTELRLAGTPYKQIATQLSKEFGLHLSPTMCVRKALRLQLPPQNANSDWNTPGVTERLKQLHAEGRSFGKIAAALNAEFGLHLSRSACIGRAARLKLPWPTRQPKFRKQRSTGPVLPRPKPQPIPEQGEPLYLSFFELRGSQCRYPFGNHAPYLFCGRSTLFKSSWCAEHHARVSDPARSRR